jgi:hypothetical protein
MKYHCFSGELSSGFSRLPAQTGPFLPFKGKLTIYSSKLYYYVRFQVLTTAIMKTVVFWDVAACSLVEIDRRFRGAYCLHHWCVLVSAYPSPIQIQTSILRLQLTIFVTLGMKDMPMATSVS